MKSLADAKSFFQSEKVFETPTSFGVNEFGKYKPNMTFIVPKEFEGGNPLEYRTDDPVREMTRNMNIDFDGSVGVIFGDYWISRKGGACFRPKSWDTAKHVLVRVDWGGAFARTRGPLGFRDIPGALYTRRAASNGGGTGYDYLVVPVGFYHSMSDEEIDGAGTVNTPNLAERAATIREMFTRYEREQIAKMEAEARAEAQAEAASKAAKESGLGTRLQALNERLEALGHESVELGDVSFKWGWEDQLYTEENVARFEQRVAQLEADKAEQERLRLAREQFQPKFEAFRSRVEVLGLTIEYREDSVRIGRSGEYRYSHKGLAGFMQNLDQLEREAAEARAEAQAEAAYQKRKSEAAAKGLPTDIRIWCRRGGWTNAGDGWCIGPDGQDRDNTAWYHPRPRHTDEGDKIWEQILEGEIVLKWSKAYSAAEHEFEVVHLPAEGLTEAQLERILEIQDALEAEWEGACGLASGLPSPPVGKGWGLVPEAPNDTEKSTRKVDLSGLFGGNVRVRK